MSSDPLQSPQLWDLDRRMKHESSMIRSKKQRRQQKRICNARNLEVEFLHEWLCETVFGCCVLCQPWLASDPKSFLVFSNVIHETLGWPVSACGGGSLWEAWKVTTFRKTLKNIVFYDLGKVEACIILIFSRFLRIFKFHNKLYVLMFSCVFKIIENASKTINLLLRKGYNGRRKDILDK